MVMSKTSYSQPTYNLSSIKSAMSSVASLRITGSSRQTIQLLGFDDQDVVDAIQSIKNSDFHKTMPSNQMPTAPNQDVYKFSYNGVEIYAKFQNLAGFIVVSFKER